MTVTPERKEWVRVSHSPSGTLVSVTLQQGTTTVKWTVKAYTTGLDKGVREARAGAEKALDQLAAAIGGAS